MQEALVWWLAYLGLGLAALPITLTLFRRLPDGGYGLSRALGLLLFGYAFWLLGTFRVLPNSQVGAWGAFLLVAALAALVFVRRHHAVLGFLKRRWGLVLATELVFALVFAIWGVLRRYSPEIAHTEQPMDFALLNGILASPHFPPSDPWYAGGHITYYYGGYLMQAGVTQLTGITPAIAYNLALMALAGMAATGAFSLAFNIVAVMREPGGRRAGMSTALACGGLAVVLLLFMGNLVGALEYLNANDVGSDGFWSWVRIGGLDGSDGGSTWYPSDTWWWWRSTRVINSFPNGAGVDYTITEFPLFSFMLGDMHPHVMALPFVMLAMGLAFSALRTPGVWGLRVVAQGVAVNPRWGNFLSRFVYWWTEVLGSLVRARRSGAARGALRVLPERWDALAAALILGALGFVNSWDLPAFTGLFFAVLVLRAIQERAQGRPAHLRELAGFMALMLFVEALLYAPFYLFFDSQASGVKTVREAQTRQIHYLLVLGPLLALNLALLGGLAWSGLRTRLQTVALWLRGGRRMALWPARAWLRAPELWAAALPLVPFALWAIVELALSLHDDDPAKGLLAIGSRFWHLLPLFLILSIGLVLLFRLGARQGRSGSAMQFVVLAILLGFLVTMGAELFRIADFFNNRMNTVFKFYYQAWVLMAVAGAAAAAWWWQRRSAKGLGRAVWWSATVLFAVFLVAGFLYVPAAAYSKAERFDPSPTLNALAQYERSSPDEFEAVQWIRHSIPKGAVVLEGIPLANGRPQGDYDPAVARISRNTGRPTVLGWAGHEHQWRGGSDEPIIQRARDVEAIYRSASIQDAQSLMRRYNVQYVVVGGLERGAYGQGVEQRLASFLDVAWRNESVVIYRPRPA